MASKLPQFENEQPILQPQSVPSHAQGFEAFSQFLGQAAKDIENVSVDINKTKSQAMLIQSSNMAEDLKTQTLKNIVKDPAHADQYAKSAKESLDAIKQSTKANRQDHLRLDSIINQTHNSIDLDATKVAYRQNNLDMGSRYWANYPEAMNQITTALSKGDLDKAKSLEKALFDTALTLNKMGAISPEMLGKISQSYHDMYNRTAELLDLTKKGGTAKDYHAANNTPFSESNIATVAGTPSDALTTMSANHLNDEKTFGSMLQGLYNNQKPDFSVVLASEKNYQSYKLAWLGVNDVKSSVQSSMAVSQIDAKINNLANKPFLTEREKASVNYWKSQKYQLQQEDGFFNYMNQTSRGAGITLKHQAESESILNSGKKGADLYSALKTVDNKYIGQMKSEAIGMHMDPSWMNLIPSAWAKEVKDAFQSQAPVLPAIQRINYVDPEYRANLANRMPTPHQGMAVYVVGNSLNKTDISFQADLIQANQNPDVSMAVGEKGKKKDEKEPSSLITPKGTNIWEDIINEDSGMKDLYAYLGKMPGFKAAQDGFRTMAVNYVKYKARRAGDVDLSNESQYVKEFTSNALKGFNFYRTTTSFINLNDIKVTRVQDADYLSHYALSEAYKNLHEGKSEAEFLQSLEINPLMVVSTPDQRLVVMDRYGRVAVDKDNHEAFDMQFTPSMVSKAEKRSKEINDYLRNYGLSDLGDITGEGGDLKKINEHKDNEFPYALTPQSVMLQSAELRRRAENARVAQSKIVKKDKKAKP